MLARDELVARAPGVGDPRQLRHTAIAALLARPLGGGEPDEAQPVEVGGELDLVGEGPAGVEQLVPLPGTDGDAVHRVVHPQPHGAVLGPRR